MNRYLEELEELIKTTKPDLYSSMQPGVPDIYMEAEFGPLYEELPNELKAIWNWHNGQGEGYKGDFHPENHERLMSVDDSVETIEIFNDSTEIGLLKGNQWQDDWVPLTLDASGNHLCVEAKSGKIYYFDRNNNESGLRYATINDWLEETIDAYKKL